MAGVEVLVMFWKEWGIQALVLLSFALQVILLISAEIRNRKDSGMLRAIVWSAFMLADTTAIYALGHMSVNSSKWLPKHQLMAFWAPFLLLHLGGQDKITAYSVEDNRLWLWHLQTFTVQVLAAGYVLYESSIVARRTLLRPAAILMFVVGVMKYGERVWALNCASTSNLSRKNYQSFGRVHIEHPLSLQCGDDRDGQVLVAHQLLRIPMHLLKGPLPLVAFHRSMMEEYNWGRMYEVAEVQLSLMYEVFFSKAPLIHTWYGRCIHVISPMASVAAFMLFHRFSQKDGDYYSRVDVAATNVLLTGAVVMEITSLLRAMFSSWAEANMANPRKDDGTISFYTCLFPTLIWVMVACPRCLVRCAMRKAGLHAHCCSTVPGPKSVTQTNNTTSQ